MTEEQIDKRHNGYENPNEEIQLTLQSERAQSYSLPANRHFGNMIPLKLDHNGDPIYILGPHFYVFVVTLILSTIGALYILIKLYSKSNPLLIFCSAISTIIFIIYYTKIGLSSPGIASSTTQPPLDVKIMDNYCIPCRVLRQPGTRHCYFCDICIYNYDHHCPWVGKCIGRDNMSLFIKFLVSVTLLMIFMVVTAVLAANTTAKEK